MTTLHSMVESYTEDIDDFVLQPSVVFTPHSFFHDRFQPGPDVIQLPHRVKPGGQVTATHDGFRATLSLNPRRGFRLLTDKLTGRLNSTQFKMEGGYFVDLRMNSPQNWSHLLNYQIPLLAFAETRLGLSLSEITAIFPYDMPPVAKSALSLLGVNALFTDGIVEGRQLSIHLSHGNVQRINARSWFLESGMWREKTRIEQGVSVPKRIFIRRRGTRGLVDQEAFEQLLTPMGFTTVYPESLSVAEQFALFGRSEIIVAVHGAALGPLLLRDDSTGPPPAIVGIMPSGVVSDFFRMMSQQVGSRWVGIRGKIRPEYVPAAYDLKRGALKGFESHSVEIDSETLLMAIDHALNAKDHRIAPT